MQNKSQNAAREIQLWSQSSTAQGLAELSGTVHKRRREGCLLTREAWECISFFWHRGRFSRVSQLSSERRVVCVAERAWSFVVGSGVARCCHSRSRCLVPELDTETSAKMDGQLFKVLSAVTGGESFDVVTSTRWRSRPGELAQDAQEAGQVHRSLLREIFSPPRAKLIQLWVPSKGWKIS